MSKEVNYGISVMVMMVFIEIVSNLHNVYLLEWHKFNFREQVHFELESMIQWRYVRLKWNGLRELKKQQIDRVKNNGKMPLFFLINNLVVQIIQLFPFFGYVLWLFWISPLSVMLYFISLGMVIKLYPRPTKELYNCMPLWDKYHHLVSALFTNIVHHNEKKILNKMINCMVDIEKMKNTSNEMDTKYMTMIDNVFNLVFIANLVLFVLPINDITIIVVYIQYTLMVRTKFKIFLNLYKEYQQSKREYNKIDELLSKYDDKEIVPQLTDFSTMIINRLEYTYPLKNADEIPFSIELKRQIIFSEGDIILLDGDSGNGKSSFMDIMAGIIPYKEYEYDIHFDGKMSLYGFDVITEKRIYAEQFESVDWRASVYEIVSDEDLPSEQHDPNNNNTIEEYVWQALTMCKCQDFLKRDNQKNSLKNIYTKNIDPSGGQQARILNARSMYRTIRLNPRILILDEIDKALPAYLAVDIIENIFNYCRNNKIICIIAAHTIGVKNMAYDQVIRFIKGNVF